jgi:TRAP-type C4-dicarboxylate transport system substrate-binding protein
MRRPGRCTLLAALSLAAVLPAGCGQRDGERPEHILRMANVLAERDITGFGLNKFAELVAEKSGGRVRVDIYHGGQLGSGVETFSAVRNGHLDIAADSFANLAGITRAFEVFHLPFLFATREQMLRAYHSERVRATINAELAGSGLRWLAMLEIGGPRQVATTRRRLNSLDDLAGLKLRASRSPLEIAAQEAWGARGVTVDWPETPEALRLGMVDGLTVPYASIHSARLHEGGLLRHILDLNFQCYAMVVVVGERTWRALPEDLRAILAEAAREAEAWHIAMLGDQISAGIAEIRAAGVEIHSWPPEELERARRLTRERVWGDYIGRPGISREMLNLIEAEMGPPGEPGWGYRLGDED